MSLEKKTWQELSVEIDCLHRDKIRTDKTWTTDKTAKELKRSIGAVSQFLSLASFMRTHPDIAKQKYLKNALQYMYEVKLRTRARAWIS